MKIRSSHLKCEFQYLSKGTLNIIEFLAHVHANVDTLMSIVDLFLHINQFELIPEALLTEYDSVVPVVNIKFDYLYLNELESLLLTQVSHVEKTQKEVIDNTY